MPIQKCNAFVRTELLKLTEKIYNSFMTELESIYLQCRPEKIEFNIPNYFFVQLSCVCCNDVVMFVESISCRIVHKIFRWQHSAVEYRHYGVRFTVPLNQYVVKLYRVAQIKIPHWTKCNFSTTVCDFYNQIFLFIWERSCKNSVKFKKIFHFSPKLWLYKYSMPYFQFCTE